VSNARRPPAGPAKDRKSSHRLACDRSDSPAGGARHPRVRYGQREELTDHAKSRGVGAMGTNKTRFGGSTRAVLCAAAVWACVGAPAFAATNLITNPTFAGINIPQGGSGGGWTFIGGAGAYPGSGAEGGYINNIGNPAGTIEQSVGTTPGDSYLVDFFLTKNCCGSGNFTVQFGSKVGYSATDALVPSGSYAEYSFVAQTNSASTLFSFNGSSVGGTTWIDSVSVTQVAGVPEPATWLMLILGLGGLGAVLRRRQHSLLA
jgi:hypothetical protein